jgi:hypothetical protein
MPPAKSRKNNNWMDNDSEEARLELLEARQCLSTRMTKCTNPLALTPPGQRQTRKQTAPTSHDYWHTPTGKVFAHVFCHWLALSFVLLCFVTLCIICYKTAVDNCCFWDSSVIVVVLHHNYELVVMVLKATVISFNYYHWWTSPLAIHLQIVFLPF